MNEEEWRKQINFENQQGEAYERDMAITPNSLIAGLKSELRCQCGSSGMVEEEASEPGKFTFLAACGYKASGYLDDYEFIHDTVEAVCSNV